MLGPGIPWKNPEEDYALCHPLSHASPPPPPGLANLTPLLSRGKTSSCLEDTTGERRPSGIGEVGQAMIKIVNIILISGR